MPELTHFRDFLGALTAAQAADELSEIARVSKVDVAAIKERIGAAVGDQQSGSTYVSAQFSDSQVPTFPDVTDLTSTLDSVSKLRATNLRLGS